MNSKVGDYMIVNADGTKHICDKEIFENTYEHIGNQIYRKIPIKVRARKLTEDTEIETLEGKLIGKKDSFIVKGLRGEEYSVTPKAFEDTYTFIQ